MQKDKDQLRSDVNGQITTNNNREITASKVRTIFGDLIDSFALEGSTESANYSAGDGIDPQALSGGNIKLNLNAFETSNGIWMKALNGSGVGFEDVGSGSLNFKGGGVYINDYSDGVYLASEKNGERIDFFLSAENGFQIQDNRTGVNQKGIEYGSDYSNSFTDRSLVDKAYVDNKISSWIASAAYSSGKRVRMSSNIYECISNHTSSGSFTNEFNSLDKWMLISEGKKIVTGVISGATNADLSLGNLFIWTTGSSNIVLNHSNALVGHTYYFKIKQGTTPRAVSFAASKFMSSFGVFPALTFPQNYNASVSYSPDTLVLDSGIYYKRKNVANSAGDIPASNPVKWQVLEIVDMITAICLEPGVLTLSGINSLQIS